MTNNKLKKSYLISLKGISIFMPLRSFFLLVIGLLIMLEINVIAGIIIILVALSLRIECFFLIKYINKKIVEILESEKENEK
ncbi:MAG: hypothetical protein IKP12_00365 [Acholeplasmatales bacterium]|nr:hypothetical protein [Acholeplasmatales bacterium]